MALSPAGARASFNLILLANAEFLIWAVDWKHAEPPRRRTQARLVDKSPLGKVIIGPRRDCDSESWPEVS